MNASLQPLEPRRLFAFAALDPNFAGGGVADAGGLGVNEYGVERNAVVPLDDGRIILAGRTTVRYLRGDGTPDPKRRPSEAGVDAFYRSAAAIDVAVDPATGRVASLLNDPESTGGVVGAFAIEVRSPDARKVVRASFHAGSQYAYPRAIAFAGDDVIVLVERTAYPGGVFTGDPGDTFADVYRYAAATLAPLTTFGTAGVARTLILSAADAADVGAATEAFAVDAAGRIYLRTAGGNEQIEGRYRTAAVTRLLADGSVDRAYGANGVAELFDSRRGLVRGNSPFGTPAGRAIIDWAVAPGGDVVAAISAEYGTLDGGIYAEGVAIRRLDAAGAAAATAEVGRAGPPGGEAFDFSYGASVALDGGRIYVARRDTPAAITHLYRLDAQALVADPAWGDALDGTLVAAKYGYDGGTGAMAVARRFGRLLLTGGLSGSATGGAAAVTAYVKPAATLDAAVRAGAARRLADGTIVVRGTRGADRIALDVKGSKVYVQVNGATSKFTRAGTRGYVVLGGDGDDTITAGAADSAYLDGGAGDDSLRGGTGYYDFNAGNLGQDTLLGGAGDDLLDGQFGDDDLFGGDGDDTILGGDGADRLFGNRGDDRLYASGTIAAPATETYPAVDLLDAGRGRDVLWSDGPAADVLAYTIGEDTVRGL